ncbi:MAG: hypothetical protein J7K22_03170 [Nanoarchaeota archaeon]|nr:hypothetical protein [Nanoarchaeota archaeon]
MSLGEDIPILIPISIALTIFVFFTMLTTSNISEKYEAVKMSQKALTIGEYVITKYSNEIGLIQKDKLGNGNCSHCKTINNLNITTKYKLKIIIKENQSCWCWGKDFNTKSATKIELPIVFDDRSIGVLNVIVGK